MSWVEITRSEEETEQVGERLGRGLTPKDVAYLIGDLGSGKTCLTRGIARGLGASSIEVASPTFAILHEYADAKGTVRLRHLDFYRLRDDRRELEALGLPDVVEGAAVVVEWPGTAVREILPATREVSLVQLPDGARRIEIGPGTRAVKTPR